MAVTNTQWCDFVVWTPQWISVQRIPYDEEWTTSMLVKLMVFYQSALFPQLLQVKPVSHPVCASTPTAACCSGCAYSGLVLRTCMRCQHTFHHLCTSDDEGKVCKCCKRWAEELMFPLIWPFEFICNANWVIFIIGADAVVISYIFLSERDRSC